MRKVNPQLKDYIESTILPQYGDDQSGHGLHHIAYVMDRSMRFAEEIGNLNIDMVYTIAAFHDIGHPIDKAHHEIISAKIFLKDEKMPEFFTDSQRKRIAEAIEDHRASANHTPRSIYGKIVSTADRSTDIKEFLRRTHAYTLKHEPNLSDAECVQRAYQHMKEKYGRDGYAKSYLSDTDYTKFLKKIESLLQDYDAFENLYRTVIQI